MLKKIALSCIMYSAMSVASDSQLLDKVVAVVNNSVITASELNAQVEQSKKQIKAQNLEMPKENVLRKQVLQHLIDIDLQLQMAKQHNIIIDSKELNETIEHIAQNNHLTATQLREELEKEGVSWQAYRSNIRKEMLMARLQQQAVGKDVLVTSEQIEQFMKTAPQVDQTASTYRLQNIVIPLNDEPTSDEVNKAYQFAKNLLAKINKGADFSTIAAVESNSEITLDGSDLGERHLAELPEIFAKAVLTMKSGQVAGPLRTGNGFQLIKLVSISGDNQHHVITQTHVRHILIKPDASMLPEDAKKQVKNIYQQLKSGKNFAEMAKNYSLDTGSAVKGGDLGWVTPGELVPEFEKTMNSLAPHKISEPVKSKFGWHLIEVLERRQKDDTAAFKRQQIQQFLQQRKFGELVQSWQQRIRSEAYINILEKDLA